MVQDPGKRLTELPLLSDRERQRLLFEWNDTETSYPRWSSISQLFEEQVAARPEATAIVFEGRQVTYGQLNAQANRLAHHLIALGVGPEVMVGICLERSVELIVGILGIVKAGGAYVPLDLEYPKHRLAFMLGDTSAPVLVTQSHLLKHLPDHEAKVVCLDTHWNAISGESDENPEAVAGAQNLAYVMYTSGSTGRPKGTCIEHGSVVRLVKDTNYVELGPQEVFLQFAPISFDASTFELWASLLNGAKLVVFAPHKPSLEELGEFLQTEGITTVWLTAALFHQMVDAQLDSLCHVRQILAGGEALSVSHVQKMIANLGNHRLINGYGPTENTTFTTCHVMTSSSRIGRSVPIGVPISNTQVYVLDPQLQPVPVGVHGELYIGGDGLARGYLNAPELTKERFIAHPFSEEPGARLYKTGDMVRYLADGSIEYIGRRDHQVKIRGFRVELGEIEVTLKEHGAVEEAVVLCRQDTPGEKRLVAYVVLTDEAGTTMGDLKSFVRSRLPGYMVPSALVSLAAMPLTPNGKIDRHALPQPDRTRRLDSEYVPPRTEAQRIIAAIWQDILKVSHVGIHDNFFDLGGHSLLVMELQRRLGETFHTGLSIVTLFEHPTVYRQASLLGHGKPEKPSFQAVWDRAEKQKESLKSQKRQTERPFG
jgi:aspartate racemase